MKKIASFLLTAFAASTLFALPIHAEEATMAATKTLAPEIISCTQSAIESRDTSIMGAMDAYASAVKMALTSRKEGLKMGWAKAKPADIRAALKETWSVYKKAISTARKAFKEAKSKAWKQFKTERAACKGGDTIEVANPQVDNSL